MPRDPHVRSAELRLEPGVDPAAVGAAVTTGLCGHWEHEGPCRWPHHNAIAPAAEAYRLRVVFVAPPQDVDEVETRIDAALRAMGGATVVAIASDDLHEDELALGARLASS